MNTTTAPETVIADDQVTVYAGDCLDVLRAMPDDSVDAVVTDPPYGLGNTTSAQVADTITRWVSGEREFIPEGRGFMGRPWDAFVPPVAVWDECLRVLKPGGHLVAFAGSRTFDLMTLAVRLAGFDLRDVVMWLYGSGFPKGRSYDDEMAAYLAGAGPDDAGPDGAGPPAEVYTVTAYLKAARDAAGWTNKRIDGLFGRNGMAGHWTTSGSQPAVPSCTEWATLKEALAPHLGDDVDDLVEQFAATNRPDDWGTKTDGRAFLSSLGDRQVERPHGWSSALKPAYEPVIMARKPPVGSTAANVATYGTGGLNIGACRIGTERLEEQAARKSKLGTFDDTGGVVTPARVGRWPSNVALDETAADVLDAQTGVTRSRIGKPRGAASGEGWGMTATGAEYSDEGGASRFFYTSKAGSQDRVMVDGVGHPTVKPQDLMRWLVRLVTPPGGVVLDPFAGSGSTLEAAIHEGHPAVGVERDPQFVGIIRARLSRGIPMAFDLGGIA